MWTIAAENRKREAFEQRITTSGEDRSEIERLKGRKREEERK